MIVTWFAAWALAQPGPLEELLVDELDRAMTTLSARPEAPHHVALTVIDEHRWDLAAQDGALAARDEYRTRTLDVDLRVGTATLDSTHPLRGFSDLDADNRQTIFAPQDDEALRHVVRREIDQRYRDASERIVVVRANLNVKVEEETPGADFEPRTPVVAREPDLEVAAPDPLWAAALVATSEALAASPAIDEHEVRLVVIDVDRTLVDTEGARIVDHATHGRLWVQASATADDGDQVSVFEARDVHDPATLDPQLLKTWTRHVIERMTALRAAPRGDPYSGPVLLEGEAAGVFFHEVLGHRVEGHRQKREDEGKTFAEHVGRRILPETIDVIDDPTVERFGEVDLNGHYAWDDEGVPAASAPIVDDGVFVGFLMGRSPIDGFPTSNGHGRRSSGAPPLARMGNTIVKASKTVPRATLRDRLLAEVRAQGLPYGYIVEDIEGGFTMTGRTTPNAFNVRATASWRIWADGRPDELVRGIDLVGTPLVAFSNLIAAGDDPQVFNGTCGAESGWVPVSAVSPSLLFKALEFQRKEKGQERAPLLPRPQPNDGTTDAAGGAR